MGRKFKTFWTNGRFGSPAIIQVAFYENGAAIVTAEQDKLTAFQMDKALEKTYPAYRFNAAGPNGYGYWLVYGETR